MEYCPKGSLDQICDRLPLYALKEIQIMRIIRDILQGVQYLHSRQNPLMHRNLTMQNIMLGEDNNYKITNFSNVTTHRLFNIQNDEYTSIESEIKKHTTEGYRAPEQIQLQKGYPINEKVDIFAVGVILYILCFNSKPFESTITNQNVKLDLPDFPKYSPNANMVLQKMLTQDPGQRPTSSELLHFILQSWPDLKILQTKTGLLDTDIFKQAADKEIKPTMMDKFKKMFTLKLQNKRTKGWIMASLEENEQGPKQKYMRLLIIKAWQKTDKIEKFYDNFNQFLTPQTVQNTIIALKSLILLHNYIKKGPPEALSSVGKRISAVNVLKKIIETWQNIDPSDDQKDKKRSIFTTKLINMYSQRLKEKMNLCVSHSSLIEGNFSLKPFFDNMNKNFKPLTHKLVEDLIKYMSSLLSFSQEILSQNVLIEIQISLMIQLVDEMYCLLCAQTHLLVAFIASTNYLSKNIDRNKLQAKVNDFKLQFGKNFELAKQFFRKCQNALSQSSQKDYIPQIDSKVVDYINQLSHMQDSQNEFNLFEFLNYKKSIHGIKLPLSYGATIQTNSQSEEMKREMENVIKKPPPGQKLIQLDDQKTTSNSNSNSQDTKEKNYDFQKQFKKKNQLSTGENLLVDEDVDDFYEQQEAQRESNYVPTLKQKSQDAKMGQNKLPDKALNLQTKHSSIQFGANQNENLMNQQRKSSQQYSKNTNKSNFNQINKKYDKNTKEDYLMEDEDESDEENPNLDNNHSDSDEQEDTCTINANNQNLIDINEQGDDQENLQQEFTHQSLNNYQYKQGEMNYENSGMPQNLDKYKNYFDYNEMNNSIQQGGSNQHQKQNSMNNSNIVNNYNQQINTNTQNQIKDAFDDFNNFHNFGLQHSQSNINISNNTANNSFQNRQSMGNFNDFNFQQFDNSNINQGSQFNNNTFTNNNFGNNNQSTNRKINQNPQPQTNQNNGISFNQYNDNRNNNSAQKNNFQNNNNNSMVNSNSTANFQMTSSQQSSAQKNSQNQYDFFQNSNSSQQMSQNRIQMKFELKENKVGSFHQNQQITQSQHQIHPQSSHQHSQSAHNGSNINTQLQYKQQSGGNFNNIQQQNVNNQNKPLSQSVTKPLNNFFDDFNFVNLNNSTTLNNQNNNGGNFFQQGFQQNQQQQQNNMNLQQHHQQHQGQNQKQNNFFNQPQQTKHNQQQMHQNYIKQKQLTNNAEEFDENQMVENSQDIQITNAALIKRNDLNQLNQVPQQAVASNINQAYSQNKPNNYNNQIQNNLNQKQSNLQQQNSLASVNSAFSSNNENLIELKNFIINRVKHDPNEIVVEYNSITFGKKIGSGHSGKVFSGMFNNVEVAIKEMEVNLLNERNQKEFQREIETLVKISPQINLVSLIGVAQKKDNFYIITELCNGGTMFDLLHRKSTMPLPWLHRVKMCKDIATGMIYLHSLDPPIIHRDLKSLNLLLDIPYEEDSFDYNVKIADFGLARTESKDEMTQVLGTFHWMAPEVFENKQYTIKADVYSYAIVVWEFISRKTPYQKMNTLDIMKNVCEGKRPTLEFIPSDCPQQLVDLMKECWEQDPVKRPDFKDILERLVHIESELMQLRQKSNTNLRPNPPSVTNISKQSTQQPPKPQGAFNPPMYQNQMRQSNSQRQMDY